MRIRTPHQPSSLACCKFRRVDTPFKVLVVLIASVISIGLLFNTPPNNKHMRITETADQVKDKVKVEGSCQSSDFPTKPEVPLFVKWEHFLRQPSGSGRGMRNLYFVQVGANVGKNVGSGDPIWEYVRPCGWSGAVVEPMPFTFQKLKENYQDLEATGRVVALNYGVSEAHGYAGMLGGGELAKIGQVGTDRSLLKDNENVVEIVTLSQIWDMLRSRIPSTGVDILVLDVEGNEAKILARGEMPRPRPAWILFEIAHLSHEVKDEIDESLRSQGYRQSADLIHRDDLGLTLPAQDRLYELVE